MSRVSAVKTHARLYDSACVRDPPFNKGSRSSRGQPKAVSEATELELLARRVRCLCPDRRDPERFHLDKSEIVAALRRLAREIAA